VSPRQNIHRADHIGVFLVAALHARKPRLRLAVVRVDMAAGWACPAGVVRRHGTKVSVSALLNSLKGVSSRMIRKKNDPSIRQKLWGGALWPPSYFAGSCGGAPIDVIRQHIEQQRTPH